jgi:polyhydroxyalkanoate synthesis regulator phasin
MRFFCITNINGGIVNRLTIAILAATSLALVGCGKEETPVKQDVTAKEVKQEAKEAVSAAAQYAQQGKDEFVKSAEMKMEELKAKTAQLKQDAQAASGEARANLERQIQALEEKSESTQARLSELKNSSGGAWQDMKQGFGDAMTELDQSYDKAISEFKDQKK